MRIVYGVHGYGRGHATRALAVAQRLSGRHEILAVAGQDAYDYLESHLDVVRIPNIGFYHNANKKISNYHTLKRNIPAFLDSKLNGATVDMVCDVVQGFGADLVISDSELFVLSAAKRLGIPRVLLDHFGLLVYCKPQMPWHERVVCQGQAAMYRLLFGKPNHIIVCGFFDAPTRHRNVCVVGPILRQEVREVQPSAGEHLLAYISKGAFGYNQDIEAALMAQDCPVLVYGAPCDGSKRNLEFKPFSNRGFLEDLASCRAVLATTGNQLIGETLHFRKPILGTPIACLEQRLNAHHIEHMGFGMRARNVTAPVIEQFFSKCDAFKRRLDDRAVVDGTGQAVAAVEQFAGEIGL